MKIVPKIIVILVVIAVLSTLLFGCAKKTNSDVQITSENNSEGKLVVKVVDKNTKKPVNGAKITIVGVDNIYKTDDNGQSPEITLKINKDFYERYGDNLSQKAPAGSATVVVTKEGYKDYIVFNKSIYPGYASNSLNIELPKLLKTDKVKYVADIDSPHDVWVEELIDYCKNLKEDKEGSGENKVNVTIKDKNKKGIEGVAVIIPELAVKGVTDKTGKVVLKPGMGNNSPDYVAEKSFSEYTFVAIKEGYMPEVLLNGFVYNDKDCNLNLSLQEEKVKGQGSFVVSCQPADKAKVERLLEDHKKTGTD